MARRPVTAAALLAALGVIIWLVARPRAPEMAAADAPDDERGRAAEVPQPVGEGAPAALPVAARAPRPVAAGADAAPADPEADAGHSHPITAAHTRIFRENQLIGAAYGAIDVEDGAGVRRLADEYRREFPEDPSQVQEGLDLLADCLQRKSPAVVAAARRYDEEQRGSILRRFVQRLCLADGGA